MLGSEPQDLELPNHVLAHASLSTPRREKALRLLGIAAMLQFTVFGIPSVYYGDEVGMEGYHDPFCRFPFPWHEVEGDTACAYRTELLGLYRSLGDLRRSPAFHGGDFSILYHTPHAIAYERVAVENPAERYLIIANRGDCALELSLADYGMTNGDILLLTGEAECRDGVLTRDPDRGCVVK